MLVQVASVASGLDDRGRIILLTAGRYSVLGRVPSMIDEYLTQVGLMRKARDVDLIFYNAQINSTRRTELVPRLARRDWRDVYSAYVLA